MTFCLVHFALNNCASLTCRHSAESPLRSPLKYFIGLGPSVSWETHLPRPWAIPRFDSTSWWSEWRASPSWGWASGSWAGTSGTLGCWSCRSCRTAPSRSAACRSSCCNLCHLNALQSMTGKKFATISANHDGQIAHLTRVYHDLNQSKWAINSSNRGLPRFRLIIMTM